MKRATGRGDISILRILLVTVVSITILAGFSVTAFGAGGDKTPPVLAVHYNSPQNPYTIDDVTITADANDDVALKRVEIFVDNIMKKSCRTAPVSPCKYTKKYAEGTHTFYAKAYDTSSNLARDPNKGTKSFDVTKDKIAPTVSISHSPDNPVVNQEVTYTATANDDVEVAQITINVDSGGTPIATCKSSPCEFKKTYTEPGRHWYYAKAKDTTGNAARDPPGDATKTVGVAKVTDVTAPTVSVSVSPENSTEADTVTFTATASDDVALKEVNIYIDNFRKKYCTSSPCTYSAKLKPGTRTYYAEAKDPSGNVGKDPGDGSYNLKVKDITPPQITSVTSDKPVYGKSSTVRITAKGTDNVGITKFEIYVDDVLKRTCEPPSYGKCVFSSTGNNGYSEGTYNFYAKAYDADGNSALSETSQFTVDTTGPEVSVSVTNPAEYGKTITLTATATDNVGIKDIKIYLDDGIDPVATCTESPCTYDTSYNEEGAHDYRAVAIDVAEFSNVGRDQSTFDVVDITEPSVSVSHSPDPVYPGQDVTFTSTASDGETGLDSIEIYLDTALVKTCTSSPCEYTTSFASIGTHTYYALAMDKAAAGANIGRAPSLAPTGPNEFEVTDSTPPTVSVTSSLSVVKAGNNITLTATATDSESGIDTVEIFVDGSSVKSCTSSPCAYTTTYSTEGTRTYSAEAKDKAGNSALDPASGTYNFKVIPPWNLEYEGNNDPRAVGWGFAGDDSKVTISVASGILTITNPANQMGYFYRNDFTANKPSTLETVVKIESGRMPLYWINGGGYVYSAELRPDRMIIGTDAGPKTVAVDLSDIYHTVRIVGNGSVIKVYVDGVLKSSDGASPTGAAKTLVFGETSSSFGASKYNMDSLYFTDKGAFN